MFSPHSPENDLVVPDSRLMVTFLADWQMCWSGTPPLVFSSFTTIIGFAGL